MTEQPPLKLMARAAEDITVFSALLQDALVASSDIRFIGNEKSFILIANRYCWEDGEQTSQRRLCGLKIGTVEKVQKKQMSLTAGQFYNLLSIAYEEAGNCMILTFSGGGALRLQISAINALLHDVAEAHPSFARPEHN